MKIVSNKLAQIVSSLDFDDHLIKAQIEANKTKRNMLLTGKDTRLEELRAKGIDIHLKRINELNEQNNTINKYYLEFLNNGLNLLAEHLLEVIKENNNLIKFHQSNLDNLNDKDKYIENEVKFIDSFIQNYQKKLDNKINTRKELLTLSNTNLEFLLKTQSKNTINLWKNR